MPQLGTKQGLPPPVDTAAIIARARGTSLREVQDSGMYGRVQGISGLTGLATGETVQAISSTAGTFIIDVPNETLSIGTLTSPHTGTGIFLGLEAGVGYHFFAGNSAGQYMHWDGSTVTIVGGITATTGTIGGWTISATELSSGSVKIQSTAERFLLGSATAPLTGTGIFIGKDSADYEFRAGNPSGDYIHFDGTTFTIKTDTFTGSNPIFTGSVEVRGGEGEARVKLGTSGVSQGRILVYESSTQILQILAENNGPVISASSANHDLRLVASGTGFVRSNSPFKAASDVVIITDDGVDYTPGSDIDVDIATINVTGTPRWFWNENFNAFSTTHGITLSVDDAGALGKSGAGFSDLFLASGAVINFSAGDVTITHASNLLSIAGGSLTVPSLTVQGALALASGGAANNLAFFGATGAQQITVTGARDNPEGALASLLAALGAALGYGIIVDNTTAS